MRIPATAVRVALALVALTLPTAATAGENLLANPGFEEGLTGWVAIGGLVEAGDVCLLEGMGHWRNDEWISDPAFLYQTVPAVAGEIYGLRYRTVSISNPHESAASIQFLDGLGHRLPGGTTKSVGQDWEWVESQLYARAPTDAESCRVEFFCRRPYGEVFFLASYLVDDVALEAGDPDPQSCYRLSWDACAPQWPDKTFDGPGVYRLVLSASGMAVTSLGFEVRIRIGPGVTDSWRFDAGGCQTGSQLSVIGFGLGKSCPPLTGADASTSVSYAHEPATNSCALQIASIHGPFVPDPVTRYTLFQILFDHSYSVVGAANSTEYCGGAESGLDLGLESCEVLWADGPGEPLPMCPGDTRATWNGGSPVTVRSTTWGRMKAGYR